DAAVRAASRTGGLVDATLVGELETAGYRSDLATSVPLEHALALAPRRRLGGPHLEPRWEAIEVDRAARIVRRPPGVRLDSGGVATSGVGRRSWMGADGVPAHHLLDPATGRPAFTGVVQATALALTALEAEVTAKAAVLSGPERAPRWLRRGGVVVHDDGSWR